MACIDSDSAEVVAICTEDDRNEEEILQCDECSKIIFSSTCLLHEMLIK